MGCWVSEREGQRQEELNQPRLQRPREAPGLRAPGQSRPDAVSRLGIQPGAGLLLLEVEPRQARPGVSPDLPS